MENEPTIEQKLAAADRLHWLEEVVKVLDDRFRIPGTRIRFGLDVLIGLVPWLGDAVSLAISGMLVLVMARHGASGMVVLRMLGNVTIDYLVGAIPLLGDLFDLSYRANRRNLRLLKEHYGEGKHQGSGWGVILAVFLILGGLVLLSCYLVIRFFQWVFY